MSIFLFEFVSSLLLPDFNAANCSGLILIILGVLFPGAVCWFCAEPVLITMPPVDFVGEVAEVEEEPKMVEALTTRVTVGVDTLEAEAAFTPLLSRTIVGFWKGKLVCALMH